MESVSKQGWQVGKSLAECNQYMLDQEIACDVTFNVHSPDGSAELIKAHRYMLISRSPVFETMLCGDFKEATSAVIDIRDIEPQIFRDILRFVYTEHVQITEDNVLPLKQVANMYIMEQLVEECTTFLEDCLSVKNAAAVLTQSLLFDEEKLIERTLYVMRDHAKELLQSDSFLTLSQAALELFLKSDEMAIDGEEQVCQAVFKWAQHKSGRENPDHQQIRDTLGDCLKQVRFRDMPQEWFKCAGTSLLTDREFRLFHLSLHEGNSYQECRNELKNNGFNLISRKQRHIYTVNRFQEIDPARWPVHGTADAISFQTNKAIRINGICVYGAKAKGIPIIHFLCTTTGDRDNDLQSGYIMSTGTPDPIRVMLHKPVILEPYTDLTVAIFLSGQNDRNSEKTFSGKLGMEQVECGGINFTFKKNSRSGNNTDVNHGQIPGLIFTPI